MRFCENCYFNLRYCGFLRLSGFLSFQNVVLNLSDCNQTNGCYELVFGTVELENWYLDEFHPKNRRIKHSLNKLGIFLME